MAPSNASPNSRHRAASSSLGLRGVVAPTAATSDMVALASKEPGGTDAASWAQVRRSRAASESSMGSIGGNSWE